ncbi:hypothetical protein OTU49_012884 [Cherax quadricarinatus]|uniref:Uncharacterized protein n=1 Tax=Cherax quadricarinatus TaxID=27406 RepID=A0AAW0VWD4_CHEQU
MVKRACSVVVAVMAAATMAIKQPNIEGSWLPLQEARTSGDTGQWMKPSWHPTQTWPEEDEAAWDTYDAIDSPFLPEENIREVEDSGLAVMLGVTQQEDSPWLTKREPPRRLGSLMDLYRSVAHGLSPFVPATKSQVFSAAPERRSGRRPAACRFGPFGLVCWNAARRSTVMRQRSPQLAQ